MSKSYYEAIFALLSIIIGLAGLAAALSADCTYPQIAPPHSIDYSKVPGASADTLSKTVQRRWRATKWCWGLIVLNLKRSLVQIAITHIWVVLILIRLF